MLSRRLRFIAKSLIALLAAFVFFGSGVAVGRGDIQIGNLSWNRGTINNSSFDYTSVDQLYQLLKRNFDGNLDQTKLFDGIKSGLVSAAGDPYTQYFNPQEASEFDNALSGSFTGIGAELGTDADGNIVIISPLAGYPAEAAGLKPKDIIAAVNKQSTSNMRLDVVVNKIRGPANTAVTLTIIRGNSRPFDVTINRTKITIAPVKYQIDGNIGYIKISQFNNDTLRLTQKAAADFKEKKIQGVILDLRGNPGGYLDSAVDIASMWLDEGKIIVSERRGSNVLSSQKSTGTGEFKGLPTVILIDGGSASAAEIVAGALRDNQSATLVGEKTFGKGSVQQVIKLADGGELKVTTARWFTPSGANIDKKGIEPDIKIEVSDSDIRSQRDPQKDKAYELLRDKIS